MALDLNTLLADEANYPDTLEIPLGNEKVALGALRTTIRETQKAAADRYAAADTELKNAKEISLKAADLIAKMNPTSAAAAEPTRAAASATPEDYWDTDPLYEPIRKRLTPMEKALKEATDKIAAQNAALEKAAFIFGKRMFREDYERSKDRLKGDKYKDYRDPDKLAQYAVDHQLVDEFGLPSVAKAIVDITRVDEIEAAKREAYDRGLEEGRVKGRMAGMPKPSSAAGSRAGQPSKGLDPTKNFEDLGDAVAEDPEIMKALSQLGDLDPGLLQ